MSITIYGFNQEGNPTTLCQIDEEEKGAFLFWKYLGDKYLNGSKDWEEISNLKSASTISREERVVLLSTLDWCLIKSANLFKYVYYVKSLCLELRKNGYSSILFKIADFFSERTDLSQYSSFGFRWTNAVCSHWENVLGLDHSKFSYNLFKGKKLHWFLFEKIEGFEKLVVKENLATNDFKSSIFDTIIEYGLSVRQIPLRVRSIFDFDIYCRNNKLNPDKVEFIMWKPDLEHFKGDSLLMKRFYKRNPNGRKMAVVYNIPEHAGFWMCKKVNHTDTHVSWSIEQDNLSDTLEGSIERFLANKMKKIFKAIDEKYS